MVNWILLVLKYENHGNTIIFQDVLSCLSSAVRLKEVKQTKASPLFPNCLTRNRWYSLHLYNFLESRSDTRRSWSPTKKDQSV